MMDHNPSREISLRRAKTTSQAEYHRPPRRSDSYQPITSSSYHSLPDSDAVSFLSSFADSTAADLMAIAPDEEGEQVGNYVMGSIIAKGAFSVVREAFTFANDGTFQKLAVKVIRKDCSLNSEVKLLEIENEIIVWKQLKHANILEFIDLIETDYATFIFMELCPNGTLLDYVSSRGKLEENEARRIFKQLAEAVRYLHQDVHVIHRDLKLENAVLSQSNFVKLTDFGLSLSYSNSQSQRIAAHTGNGCAGSINYCPPELLCNEGTNTYASDIWSLGVILYTLVLGKFPFADGFEPRLVMKIRTGQFDLPDTLSPALQTLIKSLLTTDPEARPTISELLSNSWLAE